MHPDAHLVSQLQSLDQKMAALEKEIAALPKHIAVIEKTLESHVRRLEADRAALAANQRDRKKLDGDVQMHNQKISKLREQMAGAKTNEQYRAFQHEIEFVEKEIRKAEDRTLELMSESESLDANVKKADAALKEEKKTVEDEQKRARARTAADRSQLATASRRPYRRRRRHAAANACRLRTHSEEVERRDDCGGRQRPLFRLSDHAPAATFSGNPQGGPTDDLRKLRTFPDLQPARASRKRR